MEQALVVSLTDEEWIDLYRIIVDQDEKDALSFLNRHLRKKVLQVLEGG